MIALLYLEKHTKYIVGYTRLTDNLFIMTDDLFWTMFVVNIETQHLSPSYKVLPTKGDLSYQVKFQMSYQILYSLNTTNVSTPRKPPLLRELFHCKMCGLIRGQTTMHPMTELFYFIFITEHSIKEQTKFLKTNYSTRNNLNINVLC